MRQDPPRLQERLAARPVRFASTLPVSIAAFPEIYSDIYCVDASRLDTVAHRAKVLQRTPQGPG